MFKKFLVILSSILLVAGLFACRNNAEVEELKRQVEELKQQAEEKKEEKSEEVVGTVENFNPSNDDSGKAHTSIWNYTETIDVIDELGYQIENAKTVADYDDNVSIDEFDTVVFGSYPQSDSKGFNNEPVEWIVVGKLNSDALLLSKYILDYEQFDSAGNIENNSLKTWLNNEFCNKIFENKEYKNVFKLLSEDDAYNYFAVNRVGPKSLANDKLKTTYTNYAKAQYIEKENAHRKEEGLVLLDEDIAPFDYWTCSYNAYGDGVSFISYDGNIIDSSPANGGEERFGIRPMIQVKYK